MYSLSLGAVSCGVATASPRVFNVSQCFARERESIGTKNTTGGFIGRKRAGSSACEGLPKILLLEDEFSFARDSVQPFFQGVDL